MLVCDARLDHLPKEKNNTKRPYRKIQDTAKRIPEILQRNRPKILPVPADLLIPNREGKMRYNQENSQKHTR